MVEFGSLVLGIALGVRPVTLLVSSPVQRVELLLDGHQVAVLQGEPWRTSCDFGNAPMPHELEAVGLDASGRVVSRAHQLINLPRPAAEATAVLEWDPLAGRPAAVRLSWNTVRLARPPAVTAWIDGTSLQVTDPRRIPLPPLDATLPHVVVASVKFVAGPTAQVELAFGGDLQSRAATELTAVPIEVKPGATLSPVQLRGCLKRDGQELTIVGVDSGPSDVVLVADTSVVEYAEQSGTLLRVRLPRLRPALGDQDALTVLSSGPGLYPGADCFHAAHTVSEPIEPAKNLASPHAIARLATSSKPPGTQRLAQAVALAGIHAMSKGRRRAVVLVLAELPEAYPRLEPCDGSAYPPAGARRFLDTLRVPLMVWSLTGTAPGPCTTEWGQAEDISTPTGLAAANRRLQDVLGRQRIVWLAGRHLPQQVELTGTLPRLES